MAQANALAAQLRRLAGVLGLLEQDPDAFLQSGASADDGEAAQIEALIKQRNDARAAKDWARADDARDQLNALGIVLEDGPQGTTWRRK
ncbi:hypothetical protein EDWATA_03193 [Edwardsiella tarda ATCC 23685]|uniref:Cysteinyl-tRNA ligase anticodon binding domain-containing protein n=2 Tax=Edwardsiella tarda TaxID=636 RepID=D4F8U0_EDWTA|nr:DALR domain-containing protein [Edwardsiella tarda]EFE21844.1 hypothetical protein EDWATA_03193 [Edwardsiella tarda ATCC 23685]